MIILYGGSFNPPTKAHYSIAKELIHKYQPSQFIFIPVGNHYHKKDLIDFNYRYEMLELICAKLSKASISDYENTQVFKGTYDTLNFFQKCYPNEIIYYCIGADNLIHFDKWINYELLIEQYHFIVINRYQLNVLDMINNHQKLKHYKDHFIIENFREITISSTNYRIDLKDDVVIKEINDYIYQHHLYNRGVK